MQYRSEARITVVGVARSCWPDACNQSSNAVFTALLAVRVVTFW
jgi:hypothetical protein